VVLVLLHGRKKVSIEGFLNRVDGGDVWSSAGLVIFYTGGRFHCFLSGWMEVMEPLDQYSLSKAFEINYISYKAS
jgi:hypothetical protein